MTNPDRDPFSHEPVPAISFKDAAIGAVRTLVVTEPATTAQSRNFETGLPDSWPDGNPKMSAVLRGESLEGEPLSLWAAIPSAMLKAIGDAQTAVEKGYRLKPGDRVDVRYRADKPNSNPRLNAQKLYEAKITVGFRVPAAAARVDDPWASTPRESFGLSDSDEPPF